MSDEILPVRLHQGDTLVIDGRVLTVHVIHGEDVQFSVPGGIGDIVREKSELAKKIAAADHFAVYR
jgi:hypothetical protein